MLLESDDGTPLYLQFKQATQSVLEQYLGEDETFDDLLIEYADRYADCTAADHAQLEMAINDGQIEVIRDL